MKLKDFKNTMVWKASDCVEYVDVLAIIDKYKAESEEVEE